MGKSRYSRRHSRKMRSSRRMPFMFGGLNLDDVDDPKKLGDADLDNVDVFDNIKTYINFNTALGNVPSQAQNDTLKNIIRDANKSLPKGKNSVILGQLKTFIEKYNKAYYLKDKYNTENPIQDPVFIYFSGGYIGIENNGRIGDGTAIRHFFYKDGIIGACPTPNFVWFGGRKSRKSSKKSSKKSRKSRRKTSRK